jgi:hypothetical protein
MIEESSMKKVVLAALLTCVALAPGLPLVSFAQDAQAAPAAAPGQVQMPDAEYQVYNNANTQTDPKAKAAGLEAYLTQFPNSGVKLDVLGTLITTYAAVPDNAKAVDAANRALQLDPNNLPALTYAAALEKRIADAATDPAAKQAALDAAAGYAQKGLAATKPAAMSDADFKTQQTAAAPYFYSAIGADAIAKKDMAGAITAYKQELTSVPLAQTEDPKQGQLPDTYQLALAYWQSTPPDFLSCAFYAARFVDYAPEPFKGQVAPTAKYCYKKYHGADDGYDKLAQIAMANLFPPADLASTITPAPTPAQIIAGVLKDTPIDQLATSDKENILQNGTPDQVSTVWNSMKGKSYQFPDLLVIASTPQQVQVAASDDAKQSKTADFTFNMTAPEAVPDLPAHATPAQKLAYKRKQAAADKQAAAIAAATAVGQTVTLSGTFDSYTPKPFMITLTDGAVILPAATKTPAKAPVAHHTTPHRAQ